MQIAYLKTTIQVIIYKATEVEKAGLEVKAYQRCAYKIISKLIFQGFAIGYAFYDTGLDIHLQLHYLLISFQIDMLNNSKLYKHWIAPNRKVTKR